MEACAPFDEMISPLSPSLSGFVGTEATYVSYDIDFVDPAFAPGAGTPEVGGPTAFQALQVARPLDGVNIIGADLVEVSPPFDASGNTAFLGMSILFEMLCVMRTPREG